MPAIHPLVATRLSWAAYMDWDLFAKREVPLPHGWEADLSSSGKSADGKNSFVTFHNAEAKQVVIAFKGTDSLPQLRSDLLNSGGAAWEAIKGPFEEKLPQIRKAYSGFQISTDGHSLGGGLAQTAALEHGLSGYGQNALPISRSALKDQPLLGKSLPQAIADWREKGGSFIETNRSGDIATFFYSHLRHQPYLNTETQTLPRRVDRPTLLPHLSSSILWHTVRPHSIRTIAIDLALRENSSLPAMPSQSKAGLRHDFARPVSRQQANVEGAVQAL
ncbi:MAG: hypothetical protein PW734_07220 [Verrucomicrobium sp.]|nr:hypothetical protein [Verrucomicrobium sp.]